LNDAVFEELARSVQEGDSQATRRLVESALGRGIDPLAIFEQGLGNGIRVVGDGFGRGDVFLTQLVMAADAMKAGLEILQPELKKKGQNPTAMGKIVLGTVKGDIHDLGKTIVATMLQINGFEVVDLGVDVAPMKFVEKAMEINANIIGLSALMTTTLPFQRDVTKSLSDMGLRHKFKVVIGGAPVTDKWAREMGADAYATDAIIGVERAKQLVSAPTK
jgi:corrinoid protein of di/trimethylamine methyltransferase